MSSRTVGLPTAEALDSIREFVKGEFSKNTELSGAHDFGHVSRVSASAGAIAKRLGGDARTVYDAEAGALLHDLFRPPKEEKTEIDEEARSIELAEPLIRRLEDAHMLSMFDAWAVLASIRTKSVVKDLLAPERDLRWLEDHDYTDDASEWRFEDKDSVDTFLKNRIRLVRIAVFLADKLDANGAFVMARRSQFVGGERFVRGDLHDLKERLEREGHPLAKRFDPELSIVLESYIRLGIKNNRAFYPAWFLPVVDEMFKQQVEFYHSLLSHLGLQEGDVAQMLIQLKFPGVSEDEIKGWEVKRPDSKDQIASITPTQVEGALEIVNFFSKPEYVNADTADLIREFKPKTPKAEEWHEKMLSYLDSGAGPLMSLLHV